ncbi:MULTISPECIES: universal stress protein [Haloarcula]|uniref:Universal stress protein n=2 Tax=Haloarcula marismortui TaxID=2238 RepID=Q5V7K5_HALMA|nr:MULTISPECIES: universal stress protein [Haloarcula]AAV44472.1 universal stress protein [Haloarcula marismortui ATCC 43049]EMA18015.1 universal stress protein [Haloarcula californiae ATCC 33799]NHN65503.1 universal stress protein [Haloarcula sp. JP-Z28]QCP89667.1 universal stress protein [Haloarcula marismortui ATCC 43049]
MIETILVPVDGSAPAQEAVKYTQTVFPDANITLLTVIDPADGFAGYSGDDDGSWEKQAKAEAESLLKDAQAEFMSPEKIRTSVVVGDPVETIIATVKNEDIDQVIMGSHGRDGIQRLLVGSVAEQVMRKAPAPVTITR